MQLLSLSHQNPKQWIPCISDRSSTNSHSHAKVSSYVRQCETETGGRAMLVENIPYRKIHCLRHEQRTYSFDAHSDSVPVIPSEFIFCTLVLSDSMLWKQFFWLHLADSIHGVEMLRGFFFRGLIHHALSL